MGHSDKFTANILKTWHCKEILENLKPKKDIIMIY